MVAWDIQVILDADSSAALKTKIMAADPKAV
jgi:hypothetical protein